MKSQIRPSNCSDLPFLRRMLYEAAYWRGEKRPRLEDALSHPELSKLLENWGRAGDIAVIAEANGHCLGAAWLRLWTEGNHSFGYLSPDIPELGVGVAAAYRNMGIGRRLVEQLLLEAARAGIKQVSLSVEQDNPALHLYTSLGFKTVLVVGNANTMVVDARAA